MDAIKNCAKVVAVAVGACLALSGCAPKNIKTHPDAMARSEAIRTVVLATPEIHVFEISAGGVPEPRDDWATQGKDNVTKALIAHFGGTPVKVTELKPDSATEQELREVMALFEAISTSIVTHTFSADKNPNLFPHKLKDFDYSVGSLDSILNSSKGDALLLVSGVDRIATAGKKALNVLGTITGIAVGAFTGIALVPSMEGTALRMALADRNGTILWYNIKGGIYDLRDPSSSTEIVNATLEDFPKGVR